MKQLSFDFNNMFASSVGKEHGVSDSDVRGMKSATSRASEHLTALFAEDQNRASLGLEWARLPFQDGAAISSVTNLGHEIASCYDNVISLGIGGSYLGLRAAQDALCPSYYNEFKSLRKGRPKIYFEGNNLDPAPLSVLLGQLDPKKTFVIVISKSGETIETKAAFAVVERWLRCSIGPRYGRQVIVITDPECGALRKRVTQEQARDRLSFRSLPALKGVGGRFSELNIGLLHLAIIGVDVRQVLLGARVMAERCLQKDISKNPAYLYATLHHILRERKGKSIAVLMPFAETLRSTADWYSQLLAESIGKKFKRTIIRKANRESWHQDTAKIINVGRTPVSSRGTNDLHSIQQNNIEGENDKAITFIRVEHFDSDIVVEGTDDFLSGKRYSRLLTLAQEATEWALVRESRPNCTIRMPAINAYHWGELLFFFEMATAFEGELLGINAFDQPGVEGYKDYIYHKLHKPGLSKEIAHRIRATALVKLRKYMIVSK